MTIFIMEKELRSLKGRGHFPIPTITLHGLKVENSHQVRKTLEAVVKEVARMATTIKESERAYEKEQEEAKQQARATRSAQRTEYNFLSLNSSTPIKTLVQQKTDTNPQREPLTSTQTPYITSTPRQNQPAIQISMNCQALPQEDSSQPVQLDQQVVTKHGEILT